VLFNNNGPTSPEFLYRWDHIQQVSPEYMEAGFAAGLLPEKQTLLPSAIQIDKDFQVMSHEEVLKLRHTLNLPADREIILSVGSLSRSRKRMDYLIREISLLPEPRPFLLLIGARADDTEEVVGLGLELLGADGFDARSVAKEAVADFYRVANVFVLASMDEGFGLVYVEALSYGLPCIAHDYITSRFVLGEMGIYGDLSLKGSLAGLVRSVLATKNDDNMKLERHAYAYTRFSLGSLKPKYAQLLRCVAKGETE
jgi:glycosyltransferase involved in cell wall biosynthesis